MSYRHKGIRTLYNGYWYRSRLEAKYAAMFDALLWTYEYEPLDFDGWMPDFLLLGDNPVFVEVKPISMFDRATADKIEQSMETEYPVLLVGISPFNQGGKAHLGWLLNNGSWQDCYITQTGTQMGFGTYQDTVVDYERIKMVWRAACNRCQWKGV